MDADPARAVELYRRVVNDGPISDEIRLHAVIRLATLLQTGAEGVDADPAQSILFWRLASETGDRFAAINLANMHAEGVAGIEADPIEAADLCCRVFGVGNDAEHTFQLAVGLQKGAGGTDVDPSVVLELYRRAIDVGHVNVMCCLALLLQSDADGVDADPEQAAELFHRAIEEVAAGPPQAVHLCTEAIF